MMSNADIKQQPKNEYIMSEKMILTIAATQVQVAIVKVHNHAKKLII